MAKNDAGLVTCSCHLSDKVHTSTLVHALQAPHANNTLRSRPWGSHHPKLLRRTARASRRTDAAPCQLSHNRSVGSSNASELPRNGCSSRKLRSNLGGATTEGAITATSIRRHERCHSGW